MKGEGIKKCIRELMHFCLFVSFLEGEVIGWGLTRSRLLSRGEGCGGSLRSSILSGSEGCGSGNGTSHLAAEDVVGADLVEPATVVLVSVDVELNGDLLTGLNIELLDAVFAEDAEEHLTGVLTWHLNDVFLTHPRVACARRHSTVCLKNGNDFSC